MANELLTIDADARELLQALDRLGPGAEAIVLAAARVTGERVASEARARARRATGQLIEAITVADGPGPLGGVRVFVAEMPERDDDFAAWHEFGTKHMAAQAFIFVSAELEAAAHDRRMREAIVEAIAEVGLGG